MECPFGYSDKYFDMEYEYRHVIIPKDLAKQIPMERTLTEPEWRSLGIQMSRGWIHYAWYQPEPHILLFRRPLGTDPKTGLVDEEKAESEKKQLLQSLGDEEEEKKSN